MHELAVTKSILQIVLKYAEQAHAQHVISINLDVGVFSDLQAEWIQRYFDRLSRGTVAKGAKLNVNKVPAVIRCNNCQLSFKVSTLLGVELSCSKCKSECLALVSGREYHVRNMEVC